MRRGTTPTFTFELPFDITTLSRVRIIFSQEDNVIFVKELNECQVSGNILSVELTQEETFKFDCKKTAQIQIRVLTLGGEAPASDVMVVDVMKCLDNEVLA